jgi:Family of unknown function (DUF6088)
MLESTENIILSKIKKAKRGTLFFATNFLYLYNEQAVRKALQRLTNKGEIDRVAFGIYSRPRISKLLGKQQTTLEEIARAVAKRDKTTIVPTGDYALNKLGLSTQVPTNVTYIINGMPRKIKVGKAFIVFIRASPKHTATIGPISGLAIQAMRTIGKNNITNNEIARIKEVLTKENPHKFKHDFALAPEWMKIIMRPILNQIANE